MVFVVAKIITQELEIESGDTMILYKNTFDNIKTIGYDFPIEDSYYYQNNFVVVTDGITRDPVGIRDFNSISFEERIANYPNPSGSSMVANLICKIFEKNYNNIINKKISLRDVFIKANEAVKKLNEINIKKCDYLEKMGNIDYKKYGKEKTLVVMKNG